MTPERFQKLQDVLDRRQPDLTVVMDNVHKTHNLAAVVRTCDAVGIPEIHAITNQLRQEVKRNVASGSHKWVRIVTHKTIPVAYDRLRRRGFQILCAHSSQDAVDFREIDYTRPTALAVGAELRGPSDDAVGLADRQIHIPMLGMGSSFNVSVATAIVLFCAMEQRRKAGFYDNRRLDDDTYRSLLFEWAHPKVSDYCRRHKIPYPEIDQNGEILERLNDLRERS